MPNADIDGVFEAVAEEEEGGGKDWEKRECRRSSLYQPRSKKSASRERTESLLAHERECVLERSGPPPLFLEIVCQEPEHLTLIRMAARLLPERRDDVRLLQGKVEEHRGDWITIVRSRLDEFGAPDRLHQAGLRGG